MRLLDIDEINSLSNGDKVLVEEPRINWLDTCRVEVKNYSNKKRMTSLIPIENKLSKGHGYSFFQFDEEDYEWILILK
ncbi:hypothetical protein [Bacillus smithii]|uniref:hypothetical protein n=1 Tax=Bacillus smithii TaxID=1479 RepID=UPI003D2047A3